jgi:Flp pilus assembly pilin Flp
MGLSALAIIPPGRQGRPLPLDLKKPEKRNAMELVRKLWSGEEGQDIAEYAVMLAVILVIVVGTIRLIGSNANTVFSSVASSIQ